MNKPIKLRIFCTGVGGQGTLLATRLIGEAAMESGSSAQVSETHGMAQRGGVVESTVILGALSSPIISWGEADVVLGFEVLETFRSLNRCHRQTLVISNSATIIPYPVAIGQVQYPSVPRMLELINQNVGQLLALDAGALALEAGSALGVNMVVLGALAQSGRLPFADDVLLHTIKTRTPAKHLEANLRAFQLGKQAAVELLAT
jgi:indolepyruvate ferredoxin oxidoreductase beta subunit